MERDIMSEILKQLPVKTLLRLRCVSKLLCSIIDDPVFINSHHKHSLTRPGGVRILLWYRGGGDGSSELYSVDPEGGADNFRLIRVPPSYGRRSEYKLNHDTIQCVNGLVCVRECVWNPSTRQQIVIPPLKTLKTSMPFELGLEPPSTEFKCYPQYILGFDPSSYTYKVLNKCPIISIRGDEVETHVEYHILTLGTNSWRNIDSIPDKLRRYSYAFDKSCCIAGVIYSVKTHGGYAIMAFEVGSEKFRILPLPQGMIDYPSRCIIEVGLIEVGERLALVDYKLKTIHILEDYENNIWKLIDVEWGVLFEPIGTIHTGEILLRSKIPNKLFFHWVYYDLESKRLRMVYALSNIPGDGDADVDADGFCNSFFNKHVESLFGLKKT